MGFCRVAMVIALPYEDDEPALVARDGACLSFRMVREEARARAARFARFSRRAVGVSMTQREALLEALGVWGADAVLVPFSSFARSGRFLARVRPAAVSGVEPEPAPEPDARTFADGTALVLATSGSRGVPKAVALSASGIDANVRAIGGYLRLTRDDRVGVVLPLHYSYALVGQVLTAWAAGARVVLGNDTAFAREQLEALARERVTVLSSVASSLALLCDQMDAGAATPPLRLIGSAGGPLPLELARRLEQRFPGAEIWNQYGLTEASPRVSAVSSTSQAFWRGSVGRPLPGISARIVGGELLISGPSVMLGYLDEPEANARALRDGWLYTGDRMRQDDEGFLYHEGRVDDVVKCGGERVSLDDIAALVRAEPEIEDAVAVAIDDALAGARLTVFYVGRAEPKKLKAALAKQLSQAVLPRRFVCLSTLPRTDTGKIDVPALRAQCAEIGEPA